MDIGDRKFDDAIAGVRTKQKGVGSGKVIKMRYRKKPVEVEAVRFNGVGRKDCDTFSEVPMWLSDALSGDDPVLYWTSTYGSKLQLNVKTLEGKHVASPGDYIIRGVKGELYPCKPDVFEMTYDQAG